MKSFRTILAAIAFVAIAQVQAETTALRGAEGSETALENTNVEVSRPGEPSSLRWCNRWPIYCPEY
jgi:hypothetical protein